MSHSRLWELTFLPNWTLRVIHSSEEQSETIQSKFQKGICDDSVKQKWQRGETGHIALVPATDDRNHN